MKKGYLLKALIIIVPVLIAIFAQYYEQKERKQLTEDYKAECIVELSYTN